MSEPVVCRSEKEYKAAVQKKAPRIRIENADLARKTKLILRIPKITFIAAAGCLGAAVAAVHAGVIGFVAAPATGGASAVGGAVLFGGGATVMVPIIGLVGVPTAIALVTLAVALGGAGAMRTLYNEYKIMNSGPGFVLLARK
jgi:hypothetical protein